MYEKLNQKPISIRRFRLRLLNHFIVALLVLAFSLLIGTAGYMGFEGMPWQKALLASGFLLGGQGLAVFPQSGEGQLFAAVYALYAGFVFLLLSGIVIAPVLHRFLHRFHWVDDDQD